MLCSKFLRFLLTYLFNSIKRHRHDPHHQLLLVASCSQCSKEVLGIIASKCSTPTYDRSIQAGREVRKQSLGFHRPPDAERKNLNIISMAYCSSSLSICQGFLVPHFLLLMGALFLLSFRTWRWIYTCSDLWSSRSVITDKSLHFLNHTGDNTYIPSTCFCILPNRKLP